MTENNKLPIERGWRFVLGQFLWLMKWTLVAAFTTSVLFWGLAYIGWRLFG